MKENLFLMIIFSLLHDSSIKNYPIHKKNTVVAVKFSDLFPDSHPAGLLNFSSKPTGLYSTGHYRIDANKHTFCGCLCFTDFGRSALWKTRSIVVVYIFFRRWTFTAQYVAALQIWANRHRKLYSRTPRFVAMSCAKANDIRLTGVQAMAVSQTVRREVFSFCQPFVTAEALCPAWAVVQPSLMLHCKTQNTKLQRRKVIGVNTV